MAADGGYQFIKRLGLVPQRVIGDLDSLPAEQAVELENRGIILERYPIEKDETDLELALRRGVAEGFAVIMVAGALGGASIRPWEIFFCFPNQNFPLWICAWKMGSRRYF